MIFFFLILIKDSMVDISDISWFVHSLPEKKNWHANVYIISYVKENPLLSFKIMILEGLYDLRKNGLSEMGQQSADRNIQTHDKGRYIKVW